MRKDSKQWSSTYMINSIERHIENKRGKREILRISYLMMLKAKVEHEKLQKQ